MFKLNGCSLLRRPGDVAMGWDHCSAFARRAFVRLQVKDALSSFGGFMAVRAGKPQVGARAGARVCRSLRYRQAMVRSAMQQAPHTPSTLPARSRPPAACHIPLDASTLAPRCWS